MGKKRRAKHRPKSSLASLVGRTIELQDMRLIGSTTALAIGQFDQTALPKELAQQTSVTTGRVANEPQVLYVITFTIKATNSDGVDLLVFQARFALVYRFDKLDGISEEALQEFGQTTGLFCVWPYWREFVQNMSGRMGLPPLRIPLMRPGDMQFYRGQPADLAQMPQSVGDSRR